MTNWPPAATSPLGSSASELTSKSVPPARLDQAPFQRARLGLYTPPAPVYEPPTITLPSGISWIAKTTLSVPVPRADHAAPFQRAIVRAFTPPMPLNVPPAMTSPLGIDASAKTLGS